MRVLVGCEFSGVVRDAFLRRGHDAVSCDLLPTEVTGPHIQGDVLEHLDDGWDLAIVHPTCRYLSSSGVLWCTHTPKRPKPGVLYGQERIAAIDSAVKFARTLGECSIPRVAVENPVGLLSTRWRKPDQVIHPWQYGHEAFKATCLWLKGLHKLKPTNILTPPKRDTDEYRRWSVIHYEPPGPEREKNRSRTFVGIGESMAEQWGCLQ